MKKRREFLKKAGLSGLGLVATTYYDTDIDGVNRNRRQKFNMCGFHAPEIELVRVGMIGLGGRGSGAANRLTQIREVSINAVCDIRPEKVQLIQEQLKGSGNELAGYSGDANAWKKLCERDDIDLIYITTPWRLHTPMAVYAMEQGKHVAVEVPAAVTLEECWQLVETSEKYRKHCMMLENCCYDFFELLTLNMAQQGFFGEIVHAEGAYIHDLVDLNFDKHVLYEMWRLKENFRNGNLYPTHGLGPVCQIMNINRGDQMDYLVSVSSDDFMMQKHAKLLAEKDSYYTPYANKSFRGNMNTTTIRTYKGKTIMVQHDITSPRPYSRIHLVSGTKGFAQKWPTPARIAVGHQWLPKEELKKLEERYTPEIVKKVGELAKRIGGHGGMDFLMDWRLIDCLRNGLPLDQDVYDAALWSAIAPLSEKSVASKSQAVKIPDFTSGAWKNNLPVNTSLDKGGNTGVKRS